VPEELDFLLDFLFEFFVEHTMKRQTSKPPIRRSTRQSTRRACASPSDTSQELLMDVDAGNKTGVHVTFLETWLTHQA
jgi:hypothetical protein